MRERGRPPGRGARPGPWRTGLGAALTFAVAAATTCGAAAPRDGDVRGPVTAVTDGDTVVVALQGRSERVRLLGVDAPELHDSPKLERDATRSGRDRATIQALGARARRALAAEVDGRTVSLETDAEARDRYGRLLAWVWRDDGVLVNEALVRGGWARLYTVPPNLRHVARLRAAQEEARRAGRGLWAPEAHAPDAPPQTPDAQPGVAPLGRDCPASHPLKGNRSARAGGGCIYHPPGADYYAETRPERCYATEAEARAGGCRRARR